MSARHPTDPFERFDRAADQHHQRQLEQMLERLPHGDSVEALAIRALMRRVVGRGEPSCGKPGDTWRGKGAAYH